MTSRSSKHTSQGSDESERLLVVGGRQRGNALDVDEWHAYEKAIIAEIDLKNESAKVVVEYETPSELCCDDQPAIVFKAGDLSDDGKTLLVCTQTEIIEFSTEHWKPIFHFSHPTFNDLHHACFSRSDSNQTDLKRILITNTGLDQVLSIRKLESGSAEIEWSKSVTPDPTWERFDRDTDYRKVATTKPHFAHPNFVFQTRGKTFATRFHQQDAINIATGETVLKIEAGNPHDGIVRSQKTSDSDDQDQTNIGLTSNDSTQVFFTTTNGSIVGYDLNSGKEAVRIDLNSIENDSKLLGWCRGLCFENNHSVWVGFSRIRPTWLRKNISWIKQGFQTKGQYGTLPTRIVNYNLQDHSARKFFDLEQIGMNAVFGIYAIPTKD